MQLFAQKIIMHALKFRVLVECTHSNRTGRWFECLSLSSLALRKLLAKISVSMFRRNFGPALIFNVGIKSCKFFFEKNKIKFEMATSKANFIVQAFANCPKT